MTTSASSGHMSTQAVQVDEMWRVRRHRLAARSGFASSFMMRFLTEAKVRKNRFCSVPAVRNGFRRERRAPDSVASGIDAGDVRAGVLCFNRALIREADAERLHPRVRFRAEAAGKKDQIRRDPPDFARRDMTNFKRFDRSRVIRADALRDGFKEKARAFLSGGEDLRRYRANLSFVLPRDR